MIVIQLKFVQGEVTTDNHQVEVHQVKFSQCWVNFIIGWNSKSKTISLGISQGIIAQLINSALEFVTERVQTGALGNQLFAGQFNFLADRANFLAS